MIFLFLSFLYYFGFAVSEVPFKAVWDLETNVCLETGKLTDLKSLGFEVTTKHDPDGVAFVVFDDSLGLLPYISAASYAINGGIPQRVDMDKHLKKVEKDIEEKIPEGKSGYGILYYGAWPPLFTTDSFMQTYVNESLKYEKEKNPSLDDEELLKEAEKSFNKAASDFYVKTLEVAKKTRPNIKWGVAELPLCDVRFPDVRAKESHCSTVVQHENDKMDEIYAASSALFPSLYLHPDHEEKVDYNEVRALLNESSRISNKFHMPIYVITLIEQDPYANKKSYFSKDELCKTVKQAFDFGAEGVIFLSTNMGIEQKCDSLDNYVHKTLSPYLTHMKQFSENCRTKNSCKENEVCVVKESKSKCEEKFRIGEYKCEAR